MLFYSYLNAIQTMCPHILRYLAAAVIVNRSRRSILKDLVKVIQQVCSNSLLKYLVNIHKEGAISDFVNFEICYKARYFEQLFPVHITSGLFQFSIYMQKYPVILSYFSSWFELVHSNINSVAQYCLYLFPMIELILLHGNPTQLKKQSRATRYFCI